VDQSAASNSASPDCRRTSADSLASQDHDVPLGLSLLRRRQHHVVEPFPRHVGELLDMGQRTGRCRFYLLNAVYSVVKPAPPDDGRPAGRLTRC